MTITLNLLQDLATPHNNALVAALRSQYPDLRVITWYGMRLHNLLPWKEPLGGDSDNHYCDTFAAKLKLAARVLFRRSEKFMAVGYSTFGTRFLLVASLLLRRPFIYWTDLPANHQSPVRRCARAAAYWILKKRARPLFVVGNRASAFFVERGFSAANVVNLPIFIDLPERSSESDRTTVREKYRVHGEQCLAVAASRLDFSKGYDLLLHALHRIEPDVLRRLNVLIVGSGPERAHLSELVRELGLGDCVKFEDWLDPATYARVIGGADFFLHPARFDAFGGGTLYAMACGLPVVGSEGAGSAAERIVHGRNGFIYPPDDVDKLAAHITYMVIHPAERKKMGDEARLTAENWRPERGAAVIHAALQMI